MSSLSEVIVYFWLLPVAAQILFPLALFGFWAINRVFVLSRPVQVKKAAETEGDDSSMEGAVTVK